jgi:hypothetical protein
MVEDEHCNGVASRVEGAPITAVAAEDGGEVAPSEVHISDIKSSVLVVKILYYFYS